MNINNISNYQRTNINLYRTRQPLNSLAIKKLFRWTVNNFLKHTSSNTVPVNPKVSLNTISLRSTNLEEKKDLLCSVKNRILANAYSGQHNFNIIIANIYGTSVEEAAAAITAIDDASTPAFVKLNGVRPLLTTTPTHSIEAYTRDIVKDTGENTPVKELIVLTNVINIDVIARISIMLMDLTTELFPDVPEHIFGLYRQHLLDPQNNEKKETLDKALNEVLYETEQEAAREARRKSIETLSDRVNGHMEQRVISQLNEIQSMIRDYLTALSDKYTKERDLQLQLTGIRTGKKEETNELAQYLNSLGETLDFIDYNRHHNRYVLRFYVPMKFWEKNLFEVWTNSSRENSFNTLPTYLRAMFKEIFLDETLELMVRSGAMLHLNSFTIEYFSSVEGDSAYSGLPNPHHKYYNCWGDNAPEITKALRNNDLLTATAIVLSAVAGINFADSAVCNKLFNRDYLESQGKILRIKDTKELISVAEYKQKWTAAKELDAPNTTEEPVVEINVPDPGPF